MFQTLDFYPELKIIKNHFQKIKEEVMSLRSKMISLNDFRVETNVWNIFPLLPEEEDRIVIPDKIWKKNQKLAPFTTQLLNSFDGVKAFSFSSLSPKGHIKPHKHSNPFVTAILCLQDGGDSYIIVDGIKTSFKEDEFVIFDYTKVHEVFNNGNTDRIALLILLENRA